MEKFVLYADDDADDRAWVSEACKAVEPALVITFVENGKMVLDHLQLLPQQKLPSLIILDLNMPQLDGKRTLQLLKQNPLYSQIPVAIVSTSSSALDQNVCLQLGASLFLVKPNVHHQWQHIIKQLVPLMA